MDLLKKPLTDLTDDELFVLLDQASDELKRRNGLLGPTVTDIKNQPIEQTMTSLLKALGELGVRMDPPKGT